ncbi:MAG: cyanophycinase [Verrucomicrobia bacterium]|nr:cyanophycinase [Verrucomicrobiota bacterium]
MSIRQLWILLFSLFLPLNLAANPADSPARKLIVVGGGKVSDEMREQLLSLSKAASPHVLIIPQASREADLANRAKDNAEAFRRLGAGKVTVLDLSEPPEALKAIQRSDAIWMPGGLQRQLMRALDEAGVADAVRARVASGVPIGGTSAGAAIMSKVMLASSRRDADTGAQIPIISHGLGFWPEVIVDQHFTQRNRLERLKAAIEKNPTHAGVGIDEDTAVVFDGKTFRVIGDHTVTVLRVSNPGESKPIFKTVILQPGDTYDFASEASDQLKKGNVSFERKSVPEICESLTPQLMAAWNVPGVSIAVVRNHKLAWLGQYGIKTHGQTDQVNANTVFEAASMSKPVFAYVALQLVQEGLLDLDTPLVEILGRPYITDEPLHKRITARMVLTHTTGFPNWRPGGWRRDGPLPVHFEPGTQERYSGEGFLFLQRAVEKLTGLPTEELMQKRLLEPLGMTNSSYVWRDSYDSMAASGHTSEGRIPERERSIYRTANSAFTLYTTPADYALFLIEMMRKDRSGKHSLNAKTLDAMLTVSSNSKGNDAESLPNEEGGKARFGLGWRVEMRENGKRVYHSGSNGTGFRCYADFHPPTGNGIVIMANGVNGNKLWADLIAHAGER